jgi:hypothetical protein
VAAGYRVLAFTAHHVERQEAFVIDTVSAALADRPRLGRAS